MVRTSRVAAVSETADDRLRAVPVEEVVADIGVLLGSDGLARVMTSKFGPVGVDPAEEHYVRPGPRSFPTTDGNGPTAGAY
jgi:hypothetical protein